MVLKMKSILKKQFLLFYQIHEIIKVSSSSPCLQNPFFFFFLPKMEERVEPSIARFNLNRVYLHNHPLRVEYFYN